MLRIAICDDRPDQIKKIRGEAERYLAASGTEAVVDTYQNSLVFLEDLPRSGGYDLLLLDICMPGIPGTDVAREVRRRKEKCEIIFLTTSTEFAVEAFAVDAAQYLVKPFSQEKFDSAMDKAMSLLQRKRQHWVTVKLRNGEIRTLDLDTIDFIESFSHTQRISLVDGQQLEARQTLAELSELLEQAASGQFFSPYKGYLVNQKQIRSIVDQQILLSSGRAIPIPRRNSKEITAHYLDWRFGGGTQ